LVQEFRATAGPDFLLTMAAPAIVPTGLPQQYHDNPQSYFAWLANCAPSFDWLNVMSYDYHGAFDDPVKVGIGVNSPLLRDSTPNGPFSITNTVEAYLAAGIPADKIVLGMPTYGRSYTLDPGQLVTNQAPGKLFAGPGAAGAATQVPGVLAYYEILAQLSSGTLTRGWDAATLTPYAYNSQTGVWVSYDDPESIGYKVSYLIEKGLGGAMVFSIDDDAFGASASATQPARLARTDATTTATSFPLLNTIKAILANPASRPPMSITDPNGTRYQQSITE
jgi:chitinase